MLDEIARDRAWQTPATALRAEVAAYVTRFADELDEDGHRLVIRNGNHRERSILDQPPAGSRSTVPRALAPAASASRR